MLKEMLSRDMAELGPSPSSALNWSQYLRRGKYDLTTKKLYNDQTDSG